jgi:hypothetical protein
MMTTAELEAGLLGASISLAQEPPLGHADNSPPDFTHLEGRAVSAAFLRWLRAERVTDELKRRATAAAIPYLEAKMLQDK